MIVLQWPNIYLTRDFAAAASPGVESWTKQINISLPRLRMFLTVSMSNFCRCFRRSVPRYRLCPDHIIFFFFLLITISKNLADASVPRLAGFSLINRYLLTY